MIVDVSDVLVDWEQPILIKTVMTTTIDFEPTEVVVGRMQNCVVRVAEKEKLNPDTIDWSKEYLMVHSQNNIAIDELIEHYDADYRVISRGPWRGYGYTEVIAEETKEPVKEPTE